MAESQIPHEQIAAEACRLGDVFESLLSGERITVRQGLRHGCD